jgi:hypothetical protein
MLYSAPGNIVDWMYVRQKIKYSYAVHLRDTGTVRLIYRRLVLFIYYISIIIYSLGLCYPRNGFGQLVKRQLNLLNTLQRL